MRINYFPTASQLLSIATLLLNYQIITTFTNFSLHWLGVVLIRKQQYSSVREGDTSANSSTTSLNSLAPRIISTPISFATRVVPSGSSQRFNKAQLNSVDDTAARLEPSRNVDYLSHDWVEEDIWSSWRYIVSRRRHFGQCSREENASWRVWAKQKYKLKTVNPNTINWLKDCDITWLFGPFQPATRYSISQPTTKSPLNPSTSLLHKRPILKTRNEFQVVIQKLRSSPVVVEQNGWGSLGEASLGVAQQTIKDQGSRTSNQCQKRGINFDLSRTPHHQQSQSRSVRHGHHYLRVPPRGINPHDPHRWYRRPPHHRRRRQQFIDN